MPLDCLPQPQALTWEQYLWSVIPLLTMALMCCLQVYSNRLRRVIAAFYFPKVRVSLTVHLRCTSILHLCYSTLPSSKMKTDTLIQNNT